MMDEMKLPFSLQMVGHMDYNWGTFKQRFQLYLTTAVSTAEMPDKWKIALLLTTARSPAIDSLNIFTYTFLLFCEENVSIWRWFLQRFDVCCSWRQMRCRQRQLQQLGRAVEMLLSHSKAEQTLVTETWARPKLPRQTQKAQYCHCGQDHHRDRLWAAGSGQQLSWGCPCSFIPTVTGVPQPHFILLPWNPVPVSS